MAAVLLFIADDGHASALRSAEPASADAAYHWGYWVDHPERPIPAYAPCNFYAEQDLARLKALGYPAYYLVAQITRGPFAGEAHVMAAVDFDGFTAVWDSLQPRPADADELRAVGYRFLGREIGGRWYSVSP